MAAFELDNLLAQQTIAVGELDLCEVGLMDDKRFPWAILAPRRAGITEIFELTRADRALLIEEIAGVSDAMALAYGADKMNVAALGNQVRQLHVHVVARFRSDAAWPNPIWNSGPAIAYGEEADEAAARLARALNIEGNANAL